MEREKRDRAGCAAPAPKKSLWLRTIQRQDKLARQTGQPADLPPRPGDIAPDSVFGYLVGSFLKAGAERDRRDFPGLCIYTDGCETLINSLPPRRLLYANELSWVTWVDAVVRQALQR